MLLNNFAAFFTFTKLAQVSATNSNLQHVFSNPKSISTSYRIPTVHESAVQARRILNLSSIATLSTVFPGASTNPDLRFESRPEGLGGVPIGLTEYYASCDPNPHEPIIIAVSIATSIKNSRAGSNATLSLRYHPPPDHAPSKDLYTYSPANLPRFSLIGHIEPLSEKEAKKQAVQSCYLKSHPDAAAWIPGNKIHESWWGRLVVEEIYWFGGFGDRAYIGWIPVEVYRAVTAEEVKAIRLPGEKGWVEKN